MLLRLETTAGFVRSNPSLQRYQVDSRFSLTSCRERGLSESCQLICILCFFWLHGDFDAVDANEGGWIPSVFKVVRLAAWGGTSGIHKQKVHSALLHNFLPSPTISLLGRWIYVILTGFDPRLFPASSLPALGVACDSHEGHISYKEGGEEGTCTLIGCLVDVTDSQ